jgi:hypothetical protein
VTTLNVIIKHPAYPNNNLTTVVTLHIHTHFISAVIVLTLRISHRTMHSLFAIITFSGLVSARNKFNLPDQAQSPLLATQSISQPPIGFGTWNLKESGQNTTDAVAIAIEAGYRQIDCAAAYGNEKHVGAGIKKGLANMRLTRGQIWVTSKLWNDQYVDSQLVLL